MPFDPLAIALVEPAGHIPRQQLFGLVVGGIDGRVVHLEPPYSQSAASPEMTRFNLRRAWNMRVFTVSIGQPMISAISR